MVAKPLGTIRLAAPLARVGEALCALSDMPGTSEGTMFLDLMVGGGAVRRAARYRSEADKFRRMAETEINDKLRQSFVALAAQYEELADRLVPGDYQPPADASRAAWCPR